MLVSLRNCCNNIFLPQVLSAPRRAIIPTGPTEVTPTVAATPIKWWIIPAVLGPILLIIIILLLICWRWKKGAPKSKVEPDTIRMLETNKRKVSVIVYYQYYHTAVKRGARVQFRPNVSLNKVLGGSK